MAQPALFVGFAVEEAVKYGLPAALALYACMTSQDTAGKTTVFAFNARNYVQGEALSPSDIMVNSMARR